MEIYIVAWSGGYEQPSYTAKRTLAEAQKQAQEWTDDAPESDTIDVLRLDLDSLTLDLLA